MVKPKLKFLKVPCNNSDMSHLLGICYGPGTVLTSAYVYSHLTLTIMSLGRLLVFSFYEKENWHAER